MNEDALKLNVAPRARYLRSDDLCDSCVIYEYEPEYADVFEFIAKQIRWRPDYSCGHEHDCCGCHYATTAEVVHDRFIKVTEHYNY